MTRTSRIIANTLAVFFVVSAFVLLPSAAAHANVGLTIRPIKISETMTPSASTTGAITLTNASDQDVQVQITLQDFIPVAGAEGIQFVGRTTGVTTVRDWITIDGPSTFAFKKGESRDITYHINAPADAEPGSHFGVIFFKATVPSGSDQLRVGTQVGVLVLVTIPGEHLQKGLIHSFTAPTFVYGNDVPFTINFENTGTVYFEPKGEISITNMLGQKVGSVPIEGQVVLPTGVKDLAFSWSASHFLFGRYTAVASVVDGDGNTLTSDTLYFYAVPVWYIGIFIAGVLVLYVVLRLLRRYVRISLR